MENSEGQKMLEDVLASLLGLFLYLMVRSSKVGMKVVITRLRIGVEKEGYEAMEALIQMVLGGVEY